jgi:hypothetical protein
MSELTVYDALRYGTCDARDPYTIVSAEPTRLDGYTWGDTQAGSADSPVSPLGRSTMEDDGSQRVHASHRARKPEAGC